MTMPLTILRCCDASWCFRTSCVGNLLAVRCGTWLAHWPCVRRQARTTLQNRGTGGRSAAIVFRTARQTTSSLHMKQVSLLSHFDRRTQKNSNSSRFSFSSPSYLCLNSALLSKSTSGTSVSFISSIPLFLTSI